MTETPTNKQNEIAQSVAIAAARGLDEAKCEDIVIIDVRHLSQVTDFIVIGSGTSDRQMRTAIQKAEDLVKELGQEVFRSAKDPSATWIVLDFVDVVVHVFEPVARAHYDLEMLWGDGPRVDWSPGSPDGESIEHE